MRLVAQTDYFTSKLAADLLELFSWPQERSNAALALFPRCTDPHVFVDVLAERFAEREVDAILDA